MTNHSHLRRGSSTFKCDVCTRLTRETGTQSMGSRLCPQCYDLAGLENEVSDGYKTEAEARSEAKPLIAEIETKGGDASEWQQTFGLKGGGR